MRRAVKHVSKVQAPRVEAVTLPLASSVPGTLTGQVEEYEAGGRATSLYKKKLARGLEVG